MALVDDPKVKGVEQGYGDQSSGKGSALGRATVEDGCGSGSCGCSPATRRPEGVREETPSHLQGQDNALLRHASPGVLAPSFLPPCASLLGDDNSLRSDASQDVSKSVTRTVEIMYDD